jgi:WD40 repeat protein
MRLWILDAKTGAQIHTQMVGLLDGLALSQDGRQLLLATKGTQPRTHTFEVLGTPDLQRIRELTVEDPEGCTLRGLDFSPDGKRLALLWGIYPCHGHIQIWNQETGQLLTTVSHLDFELGMAFTPDGQSLALITSEATFLLPIK